MTLGTFLLIVLVVLLIGMLPRWAYMKGWGWGPSGAVFIVFVVVLVVLLIGDGGVRIPSLR